MPQVVARRLQGLITRGEWKPGQQIPSQRVLSEQLEVSRASLREALQTLETLGLIRSEPGRGTFVTYGQEVDRGPELRWRYADSFSLLDVFQTRIMLESQIAASAALVAEGEAVEALVAATDEMQRGWEAGDLVANVEADLLFHRIVVGQCGNRMLQVLYDNVAGLLTETQRQPIPRTRTERMAESLAEHRALIAAFRARDPEAARAAMAAHIRNTALSAGVGLAP
ncbi:transcriptional regulator, GntR family protein [Rubellimicrobium mesophilum DSM 19309]|uniref:Transcriptional regulator, GntR family protein n=1 Tax=Rubellimicrobium mesophilum DSM 19309 TaxID=442562 RepID=A0A017HMQ5_9RHOB|nr:transcriptional regulator, GntR family protein [Rubellimicrobium mesophilum DSM 19309]